MSDDSLLPPNSTPVERGFEDAARRITALPVPVRDAWNPATCPAQLLPWLAWALSVDRWDPAWSEQQQRDVITASVGVHRRKGTIGAIRAALVAEGYGDAEVIESWGDNLYDGTLPRNGTVLREGGGHWAEYRVRMARAITVAQGDRIRTALADVAPARCHLDRLDFAAAQSLRDGTVPRDGTQTYGAVRWQTYPRVPSGTTASTSWKTPTR